VGGGENLGVPKRKEKGRSYGPEKKSRLSPSRNICDLRREGKKKGFKLKGGGRVHQGDIKSQDAAEKQGSREKGRCCEGEVIALHVGQLEGEGRNIVMV